MEGADWRTGEQLRGNFPDWTSIWSECWNSDLELKKEHKPWFRMFIIYIYFFKYFYFSKQWLGLMKHHQFIFSLQTSTFQAFLQALIQGYLFLDLQHSSPSNIWLSSIHSVSAKRQRHFVRMVLYSCSQYSLFSGVVFSVMLVLCNNLTHHITLQIFSPLCAPWKRKIVCISLHSEQRLAHSRHPTCLIDNLNTCLIDN
jgi:hypothetical protein